MTRRQLEYEARQIRAAMEEQLGTCQDMEKRAQVTACTTALLMFLKLCYLIICVARVWSVLERLLTGAAQHHQGKCSKSVL